MSRRTISGFVVSWLLLATTGFAQLTPKQTADNVASFEQVWRTVRDRHPDRTLNGLNWQAVHDETRPLIVKARSMDEVRRVLRGMVAKLGSSHYSIIPEQSYSVAENVPAPASSVEAAPPPVPMVTTPAPAGAGGKPPVVYADDAGSSKLVTFGNLPETRVVFDTRELDGGAGYIRFNEFLDPVSIMPKFDAALKRFAKAPGIVLDLRGNPGGIGIMAMGIAGFFIDKEGQKLGEMKMRETTLQFVIFPRPQTYAGPLAVLVDAGSASTTEILAQGLQDLGRARIFGTRTAGAALPSDIVRLPNGDGFQFAQAGYTSAKGRVLEGNGVTPDVVVGESGTSGRDSVVDAANAWILSQRP